MRPLFHRQQLMTLLLVIFLFAWTWGASRGKAGVEPESKKAKAEF